MQTYKFNRELYTKTALLKAAYNFTDSMYIHLDADEQYFYVNLVPKKGCQRISIEEFDNEMLVQSVRHEVYQQTKNIRELLLARALSTSMIDVNAKVTENSIKSTEYTEEEIIKDWFSDHDIETE